MHKNLTKWEQNKNWKMDPVIEFGYWLIRGANLNEKKCICILYISMHTCIKYSNFQVNFHCVIGPFLVIFKYYFLLSKKSLYPRYQDHFLSKYVLPGKNQLLWSKQSIKPTNCILDQTWNKTNKPLSNQISNKGVTEKQQQKNNIVRTFTAH